MNAFLRGTELGEYRRPHSKCCKTVNWRTSTQHQEPRFDIYPPLGTTVYAAPGKFVTLCQLGPEKSSQAGRATQTHALCHALHHGRCP